MTTIEIDISEFPDAEILEAAIGIVRDLQRPDRIARHKIIEERLQEQFAALRSELILTLADLPERDDLPPPSTAALIRSMDDLRARAERFAA